MKRLLAAVMMTVGLGACARVPAETVEEKAHSALNKAEEHIEAVHEAVQVAREAVGPLAKLLKDVEAFRAHYEAGEYSAALGRLRSAVATAEAAGYDFPDDVAKRLAEAQLLLGFMGR